MPSTVKVESSDCSVCGKATIFELHEVDYIRWRTGEHIQNVFPDMTPDEREILISGTHPECWNAMFSDEEDEGGF